MWGSECDEKQSNKPARPSYWNFRPSTQIYTRSRCWPLGTQSVEKYVGLLQDRTLLSRHVCSFFSCPLRAPHAIVTPTLLFSLNSTATGRLSAAWHTMEKRGAEVLARLRPSTASPTAARARTRRRQTDQCPFAAISTTVGRAAELKRNSPSALDIAPAGLRSQRRGVRGCPHRAQGSPPPPASFRRRHQRKADCTGLCPGSLGRQRWGPYTR